MSHRSQRAHFGDPERELGALLERCALVDVSERARLVAEGQDTLDLLQRLSTADLKELAAGTGRPTVLTSPKGRIVERVFVHRRPPPAGPLLAGGPAAAERILGHLRRYTLREETLLADATTATCQLAVSGPGAAAVLDRVGLPRPERYGSTSGMLAGVAVDVLGHDSLSADGFSVVATASAADEIWSALEAAVVAVGGCAAGRWAAESWRILRGLPESGRELTEEHNPLEAGLWDAVSFDKGCYVGQEVVARLRTYDKVSRALVGLDLGDGAAVPDALPLPLYAAGREAGAVTSAIVPPGWTRVAALGYVKRRGLDDEPLLAAGAPDASPTVRVVALPRQRTP